MQKKWTKEYEKKYMKSYREKNKTKLKAQQKEWRKKNKERCKDLNKIEREKLKLEIMSYYSGGSMCCVSCGFSDMRALQVDHINGDGADHRREVASTRQGAGTRTYRWLRINNFPDGFQVLCANCNWIKREENKEYNKSGC